VAVPPPQVAQHRLQGTLLILYLG